MRLTAVSNFNKTELVDLKAFLAGNDILLFRCTVGN
jgi:hypothetical protein